MARKKSVVTLTMYGVVGQPLGAHREVEGDLVVDVDLRLAPA